MAVRWLRDMRHPAFWRGVRTGYLWGVAIGLPLLVVACVTAADLRRWEGALREAGQPEAADEVAVDARETEQAEGGLSTATQIVLGLIGGGAITGAGVLLKKKRTA